jgi:lysozyme
VFDSSVRLYGKQLNNNYMDISKKGLDIIRESESLRLTAYLCPAGVPTIGYGHTGKDVKMGMIITKARADALLKSDCEYVENQIEHFLLNGEGSRRLSPDNMFDQNQFDALVSFIFNIGIGNFRNSTVARLVKRGEPKGSPKIKAAFQMWNKGKNPKTGKYEILRGLHIRRNKEADLYAYTS